MPVHFNLDKKRGLLRGLASGALTDREIIEAFGKIVEETDGAALLSPLLFLLDKRTSLHDLSFEGLLRMKESVTSWNRRYPGRNVKTAIVASQNMHTAFAKMWQAITVAHPEVGATVELFATEEEAVAWLES